MAPIKAMVTQRWSTALSLMNQRANLDAQQEITQITDEHVFGDLRGADRRKNYWLNDDPSLERILAWIRTQR